jgi:hypothetical protein
MFVKFQKQVSPAPYVMMMMMMVMVFYGSW